MKIDVISLEGKRIGSIESKIFDFEIREDLIKRCFLAIISNKRQPYGANKFAGLRTSAHYHGRRRNIPPYAIMMGREMARLPRVHGHSPSNLRFAARIVPQAVKGREAHPPKPEKIWKKKINKKEKRIALKSAIAATSKKEIVEKRGHKVSKVKLPIVVEDKIEEINKTKDLKNFLIKLGLEEELKRVEKKKIRAGKGKMRGRKYKKRKSVLIVVSENKGIIKASSNLQGIDCCLAKNLNVELLAPGGNPGRLTIYSKSSIKEIERFYGPF